MRDDDLWGKLRASLGPAGASPEPPIERLWTRLDAALSQDLPKRSFRWRRVLLAGLAATAVLVLAPAVLSRRFGQEWRARAAVAATRRSLDAIETTLASLRPDSTTTVRVAEEMAFLVQVRASLLADFPGTVVEGESP